RTVVDQQLCPACAAPNPTAAVTCTRCAAALPLTVATSSPQPVPTFELGFAPVPRAETAPAAGPLDYLRPEPISDPASAAAWPVPETAAPAGIGNGDGSGLSAWAAATDRPPIDRDGHSPLEGPPGNGVAWPAASASSLG